MMKLIDIAAVAAVAAGAACGASNAATTTAAPGAPVTSAAPATSGSRASGLSLQERAARADSVRHSFTRADVEFMTGMIHHHAQALVMARMAPTHGASPELRVLCRRIINGQKGEIVLMQRWLRDRGQPAPEPAPMHMGNAPMHMGEPTHTGEMQHRDAHGMQMPGMLTPEQLEKLDAARGRKWDRLFLTYMIQHHRGALTMVEELFDTYGAGQGALTFKIASGIGADQSTEIDRMQRMLFDLMFETGDKP